MARPSCPKLRMLSATMNRVLASKWDKRYGTTLHAGAELSSVTGIVENRSLERSVRILFLASAAEVCGADARRYNAGAVLPKGASGVQSIRTTQTTDPRAKQTHPSRLARRSAKVSSRAGDGDSPGSAFSFGRSDREFSEPAPFGWPSSPEAVLQRESPLTT